MAKSQPSLQARAMRFLARREHSRSELQRKLAAHAGIDDDVEAILDDLSRKGWLSDARFAEQSIRSKAHRFGPLMLAQRLRSRGVDDETIAAGFRTLGDEAGGNLEGVWRSRFRAPPASERERARQVRFLQGRGFPLEGILKFLRELKGHP